MRKVLLVEYSKSFIEDINRSILISERDDVSITAIDDVNQVENYLVSSSYDIVVIYATFCESRDWNISIPVRSYARKVSDIEISEKHKIRCFGIINRSSDLFDCILNDDLADTRIPNSFEDSERPTNVLTQSDMPEQLKNTWQAPASYGKKKEKKVNVPTYEASQSTGNEFREQVQSVQQYAEQNTQHYSSQQTHQNQQGQYTQQQYQTNQYNQQQNTQQNVQQTNQQQTYSEGQQYQYPAVQNKPKYSYYPSYEGQPYTYIETTTGYAVYEVVQKPQPTEQPKYSYYPSYEGQQAKFLDKSGRPVFEVIQVMTSDNIIDESNIVDTPPMTQNSQPSSPNISQQPQNTPQTNVINTDYNNDNKTPTSEVQKLQYKVTDRFKKDREQEIIQAQVIADDEFEKDMGNYRPEAKCITVYSAKGGVGKTTIACELASFLALTKHNRGHYKVCIADFNIDFGDVMNTLAFEEHGANMTTWAEDIKMRIQRGENPEEINYTAQEISVWLQKKEETGLYALLAPNSNMDSMNIKEDEIRVMINNLVKNGGFDFVICDTGNNTRDSSFISLEKADRVLLVVTQDVNTAHCNISFLKTAERVKFDMSKINLVINLVRPAKIVGFEASDLENLFKDEKTGKKYRFQTLAKIKYNNEVALSGNNGIPLIYNTSHEFTRSMGEITRIITGEEHILAVPEKKESLFDRMFKKK